MTAVKRPQKPVKANIGAPPPRPKSGSMCSLCAGSQTYSYIVRGALDPGVQTAPASRPVHPCPPAPIGDLIFPRAYTSRSERAAHCPGRPLGRARTVGQLASRTRLYVHPHAIPPSARTPSLCMGTTGAPVNPAQPRAPCFRGCIRSALPVPEDAPATDQVPLMIKEMQRSRRRADRVHSTPILVSQVSVFFHLFRPPGLPDPA